MADEYKRSDDMSLDEIDARIRASDPGPHYENEDKIPEHDFWVKKYWDKVEERDNLARGAGFEDYDDYLLWLNGFL